MQKINKFNQYLLEKYPTVWNTRIVWMLLASLIIHILFFIIGYLSHSNPVSLQKYSVKDDYFRSGVIFIHLIISILMIVGWLIMMFKNNAFKNFYPSSKWKLFSQFVQYFIILFSCITFYFSYMTGFEMFVNNKYPDDEMVKKVEVINKTYPFLSQDLAKYTLDNRKFPQPFYDLYCETKIEKIDRNKKYFVYYNRVYQYYSVYSKVSRQQDRYENYAIPEPEKSNKTPIAYSEIKDSTKIYYFKKEVVDVSPYIKTTGLSFYNFSDVFYDANEKDYPDHYRYDSYQENYNNDQSKKKGFEINKETTELLNKNNSTELKNLLSDFLKISKEFGIKNNIDADEWTKMVYAPENPNFEVRYFIKKFENNPGDQYAQDDAVDAALEDSAAVVDENGVIVNDTITIKMFNPELNKEISPEKYFKNNMTRYFYYTDNLSQFLSNVDFVKSNKFFRENIHVYLWIAFFLSTFIFSFRITGLRSLLFSVISAGVLILFVTLVTVLYSLSVKGNEKFFVAYFTLVISLAILSVPLFMMKKAGKLVSSVLVNISMNGFVLFVFLIFGIISLHQDANCKSIDKYGQYVGCNNIIEILDVNLSYIILVCGFIFMYFYTSILQKWKAMPQ
ncbi:hypothetical protein [Chryseobacterium tongliaoense]|uniref:hypothetical protein n=1 Tax=Chryseobacterium tongliaoense TaxID=3240933 RepID=UPI00351340DD